MLGSTGLFLLIWGEEKGVHGVAVHMRKEVGEDGEEHPERPVVVLPWLRLS
jgi:hypothetical protein